MKFIRLLVTLILLSTVLGCSAERTNGSVVGGGDVKGGGMKPPVEVLHLGESEADVQARFGVPTAKASKTTVRTTTEWTYEDAGFSVMFVDGSLNSVAQWKGSISIGLRVGDSAARLAELKIERVDSPSPSDMGRIKAEGSIIRIVGRNGVVERFVLEAPSDDY